MTNTKDETLKLAKECGATTYTNRHYPEAAAVTFSPVAWEKFCEQALAAPEQEPAGLRDALTKALTSTYVCGRVWEAWNVGTMTENDFQPAAECDELLDELVHAVTTIPPAASQPAVQEPVAWADAYAISNLPAVDEAIRALLGDKTADNATAVVQAILGAVPPEQPAPVQEPCRECAGEGIQGEDGDGFVSGVTWRCDSCNGTGKSTPPASPVQKRPQNCGTGYCSCIECVMEPAPVQVDAWPCVIAEADFEQDTITLKMQCSDYEVRAGQHWLHTTKPAAQTAVPTVPMQPIVVAGGVTRFKANAIVIHLLQTHPTCDMNKLAGMDFTDEDRMQFAQLIGYSVGGYAELSYVSDESYEAAEKAAHGVTKGQK